MTRHLRSQRRSRTTLSDQNLTNVLIAVTAGGIVAAGTTLYLMSRDSTLQDSLADTYQTLRRKAKGFTRSNGASVINAASDYAENLRDKASEWLDYAQENAGSTTTLVAGAIGGGLLGITAAVLLSPGARELREDLMDAYERTTKMASKFGRRNKTTLERLKTLPWTNIAQRVFHTVVENIDTRTGEARNHFEEDEEEFEEENQSTIQDAVKLASLGLRLWQNVKAGR